MLRQTKILNFKRRDQAIRWLLLKDERNGIYQSAICTNAETPQKDDHFCVFDVRFLTVVFMLELAMTDDELTRLEEDLIACRRIVVLARRR